jgi:hypothetical protein
MSQDERLLEYLENNKSINPLTAWRKLGIYRLSAVVFNLRQDGYKIITHRKSVLNQFNEKCSFAEYELNIPQG